MRINTKTLILEDLTPEEAKELRQICWDLVVDGIISNRTHYYFEFWRTELGYDDHQGLLFMSTVFPQRAALSVLNCNGWTLR